MIIGLILYFIIVIVIYFVASNSRYLILLRNIAILLSSFVGINTFRLIPFYSVSTTHLHPPFSPAHRGILFGSIGFLALVKCLLRHYGSHTFVRSIVDCNVHTFIFGVASARASVICVAFLSQ